MTPLRILGFLIALALTAPAWAQQPPPQAPASKQFLLNQNYALTQSIANLLDENEALKKDNEALKKQLDGHKEAPKPPEKK